MNNAQLKIKIQEIVDKYNDTPKSGDFLLAFDVLKYAISKSSENYVFVALTTTHKESSFVAGRKYKAFIRDLEIVRDEYLADMKEDSFSMEYLQDIFGFIGITSIPIHTSICKPDVSKELIDAIHHKIVGTFTIDMIMERDALLNKDVL